MLDKRDIDWRKNPVGTAANIDHNFKVLFDAFEGLVNEKLGKVSLSKLSADIILSGSTDLSHLFSNKERPIHPGHNVTLSGATIGVSLTPSFDRIYSGGTDLSSIFISRKDIKDTIRPILGRNLNYVNTKSGLVLEMLEEPHFESATVDALTAETAQFNAILYKGRPLDEFFPSHQLPESAPYLSLKQLNWGKNPNATRQDLNNNFDSISRAFNSLLQYKLNDVQIDQLRTNNVLLNGISLDDLYLPKNADYDVVRVQAGNNIITGGTQNRPIVSVSDEPRFSSLSANTASIDEIILDGVNILDVLFTRKEAMAISRPELGHNLRPTMEKSGMVIHVVRDPKFDSILTDSITAETMSIKSVEFKGLPIERWFGSHTFITAGKNVFTAGTPHGPVVSIVDDPMFASISSNMATIGSLTANTIASKNASFGYATFGNGVKVSEALLVDGNDVTLANNLYLHGDRITIGGQPELDISSFLRTKVRILATQSSPIHYALIIQKKEHEHKRVLNDDTVDFVVRGDGNVGIGAFVDITSKLTVKSENGFDQLRLSNPFSPEETSDKAGSIGNIAWDDDHIYVKTSLGWKRARLDIF